MHFVERRGRTCRGDGGEASRYPRMITDAGPFAQRSDLKWPETLIIRWCPALERIGRTPGTGSRGGAPLTPRCVIAGSAHAAVRTALCTQTFLVVRPHGRGRLSTFRWQ